MEKIILSYLIGKEIGWEDKTKEKIILENGMIKGTNTTPKKIGETKKIRVPIRESCFFGGFVAFTPAKFESCIRDWLSVLELENKEYSKVNAFAKARRNSKKYHVPQSFTEYYYAFIDFYKVEGGEK